MRIHVVLLTFILNINGQVCLDGNALTEIDTLGHYVNYGTSNGKPQYFFADWKDGCNYPWLWLIWKDGHYIVTDLVSKPKLKCADTNINHISECTRWTEFDDSNTEVPIPGNINVINGKCPVAQCEEMLFEWKQDIMVDTSECSGLYQKVYDNTYVKTVDGFKRYLYYNGKYARWVCGDDIGKLSGCDFWDNAVGYEIIGGNAGWNYNITPGNSVEMLFQYDTANQYSAELHCYETRTPTMIPTETPSIGPTNNPSSGTYSPSIVPTYNPTYPPTNVPSIPSIEPTINPTISPTLTTELPNIASDKLAAKRSNKSSNGLMFLCMGLLWIAVCFLLGLFTYKLYQRRKRNSKMVIEPSIPSKESVVSTSQSTGEPNQPEIPSNIAPNIDTNIDIEKSDNNEAINDGDDIITPRDYQFNFMKRISYFIDHRNNDDNMDSINANNGDNIGSIDINKNAPRKETGNFGED